MLYAVCVETTQPIRHGRMRRCRRVFVEAPDRDQAERLALHRFRELRRPWRAVVRDVERVDLRPKQAVAPRAEAKQEPPGRTQRPTRKSRQRAKARRNRQRGGS